MGASYLGMRQCVREEGWGLQRNEREKKPRIHYMSVRRTKEEGNETSRVLEHHHSIVKPP